MSEASEQQGEYTMIKEAERREKSVIWGIFPTVVERFVNLVLMVFPVMAGGLLCCVFCNSKTHAFYGIVLILATYSFIYVFVNHVLAAHLRSRYKALTSRRTKMTDADKGRLCFLYSIVETLVDCCIVVGLAFCYSSLVNWYASKQADNIHDTHKWRPGREAFIESWCHDAVLDRIKSLTESGADSSAISRIQRFLPIQGARCELFSLPQARTRKAFNRTAALLTSSSGPAPIASLSDCAEKYVPCRSEGFRSSWGVWCGVWEEDCDQSYLFVCLPSPEQSLRYGVWINGEVVADCLTDQTSFPIKLKKGVNSATIICNSTDDSASLSIFRKKASSLKYPDSFGPATMQHMDREFIRHCLNYFNAREPILDGESFSELFLHFSEFLDAVVGVTNDTWTEATKQ